MKKIIVLEDDEMMRTLLRTLLELEDFQVFTPGFPLENPLQYLEKTIPEIILMDVNLPGFNGLSLVKLIKTSTILENTKIIMTSGSNCSRQCLDSGADAFIMKPFMPDELIRLIKQYT